MHIRYSIWIIFLPALCFWGCGSDSFKKTASGMKYHFIRDTAGPEFENGHIVYFNMDYYDQDDSMLFSYSTKNLPVTIVYSDSLWNNNGQIYKGLKMMNVGDSAVFKVNCRDLYERSFRRPIPDHLDPEEEITFHVGVLKTSTQDEYKVWQSEQYRMQQDAEKKKSQDRLIEELGIIDYYMEEKGLIPLELESGIRYIIHKKGVGAPPDKGDKVTIHYRGKLLDGTEFDNSYDKNKPFEFVIDHSDVLDGWDEGIIQMAEGARYTFYIPSSLGYGTRSVGSLIKPNSILVYDVELIKIERN